MTVSTRPWSQAICIPRRRYPGSCWRRPKPELWRLGLLRIFISRLIMARTRNRPSLFLGSCINFTPRCDRWTWTTHPELTSNIVRARAGSSLKRLATNGLATPWSAREAFTGFEKRSYSIGTRPRRSCLLELLSSGCAKAKLWCCPPSTCTMIGIALEVTARTWNGWVLFVRSFGLGTE